MALKEINSSGHMAAVYGAYGAVLYRMSLENDLEETELVDDSIGMISMHLPDLDCVKVVVSCDRKAISTYEKKINDVLSKNQRIKKVKAMACDDKYKAVVDLLPASATCREIAIGSSELELAYFENTRPSNVKFATVPASLFYMYRTSQVDLLRNQRRAIVLVAENKRKADYPLPEFMYESAMTMYIMRIGLVQDEDMWATSWVMANYLDAIDLLSDEHRTKVTSQVKRVHNATRFPSTMSGRERKEWSSGKSKDLVTRIYERMIKIKSETTNDITPLSEHRLSEALIRARMAFSTWLDRAYPAADFGTQMILEIDKEIYGLRKYFREIAAKGLADATALNSSVTIDDLIKTYPDITLSIGYLTSKAIQKQNMLRMVANEEAAMKLLSVSKELNDKMECLKTIDFNGFCLNFYSGRGSINAICSDIEVYIIALFTYIKLFRTPTDHKLDVFEFMYSFIVEKEKISDTSDVSKTKATVLRLFQYLAKKSYDEIRAVLVDHYDQTKMDSVAATMNVIPIGGYTVPTNVNMDFIYEMLHMLHLYHNMIPFDTNKIDDMTIKDYKNIDTALVTLDKLMSVDIQTKEVTVAGLGTAHDEIIKVKTIYDRVKGGFDTFHKKQTDEANRLIKQLVVSARNAAIAIDKCNTDFPLPPPLPPILDQVNAHILNNIHLGNLSDPNEKTTFQEAKDYLTALMHVDFVIIINDAQTVIHAASQITKGVVDGYINTADVNTAQQSLDDMTNILDHADAFIQMHLLPEAKNQLNQAAIVCLALDNSMTAIANNIDLANTQLNKPVGFINAFTTKHNAYNIQNRINNTPHTEADITATILHVRHAYASLQSDLDTKLKELTDIYRIFEQECVDIRKNTDVITMINAQISIIQRVSVDMEVELQTNRNSTAIAVNASIGEMIAILDDAKITEVEIDLKGLSMLSSEFKPPKLQTLVVLMPPLYTEKMINDKLNDIDNQINKVCNPFNRLVQHHLDSNATDIARVKSLKQSIIDVHDIFAGFDVVSKSILEIFNNTNQQHDIENVIIDQLSDGFDNITSDQHGSIDGLVNKVKVLQATPVPYVSRKIQIADVVNLNQNGPPSQSTLMTFASYDESFKYFANYGASFLSNQSSSESSLSLFASLADANTYPLRQAEINGWKDMMDKNISVSVLENQISDHVSPVVIDRYDVLRIILTNWNYDENKNGTSKRFFDSGIISLPNTRVFAIGAIEGHVRTLFDLLISYNVISLFDLGGENKGLLWTSDDNIVVQLGNSFSKRWRYDSVESKETNDDMDMFKFANYLAEISGGRYVSLIGRDEFLSLNNYSGLKLFEALDDTLCDDETELRKRFNEISAYLPMIRDNYLFHCKIGELTFSHVGVQNLPPVWNDNIEIHDVVKALCSPHITSSIAPSHVPTNICNGNEKVTREKMIIGDTLYMNTVVPNILTFYEFSWQSTTKHAKQEKRVFYGYDCVDKYNFQTKSLPQNFQQGDDLKRYATYLSSQL